MNKIQFPSLVGGGERHGELLADKSDTVAGLSRVYTSLASKFFKKQGEILSDLKVRKIILKAYVVCIAGSLGCREGIERFLD